MPSMSKYFCYFAPEVTSDEDVWKRRNNLAERIAAVQEQCAGIGLRRRTHYCVRLLSEAEISATLSAPDQTYPHRVVHFEINFRNRKSFEVFKLSGLADELDEPI